MAGPASPRGSWRQKLPTPCPPAAQAQRHAALALLAVLLAACLLPALGAAGDAAGSAAPSSGDRGSRPVALQGSALLLTYYSGVVQSLQDSGWVRPGITPLYGLSGGAWTAVLTALGRSGEEQSEAWKRWVAACVERWGSCKGHVRAIAEEAFEEILPQDAAEQVSGRVRVALSRLDSQNMHLNGSASWLLSSFADKADLKSALAATSYIPGFSGEGPFTLFRGEPVMDGGFANGFRQLCPEGGCITVASWYVGPAADLACDPARCGAFASQDRCSAPERREPIPDRLFENGGRRQDWPLTKAAQAMQLCQAGGEPASGGAPAGGCGALPLPDFVPHNQTAPDIHPGKFGRLPSWQGRELLACEWQNWAMRLPVGRELEAMEVAYGQGVADGAAWSEAQQRQRQRDEL